MEDDFEDYEIKRKNTVNKLKSIIKEKTDKLNKEKEKEKEPQTITFNKALENAELRKSISIQNISYDNQEIKTKLDNLLKEYIQNHKSNGYEKVPDYLDKKEDDSTLIKTCQVYQNADNEFPLILVDSKFCDEFKDFLDDYIKYEEYKLIFKLKDKLIIKTENIQNYEIFHKEKAKEFNTNLFFSETISTAMTSIYNEDQKKDIIKSLGIMSKNFKDKFNEEIEKWVTVVYNIMSDYIIFKFKNKPLYYCCDICKKPILFMEQSISNLIKENNNENKDNNNIININNDLLQKEIEIRKENNKQKIVEIMESDDGQKQMKKLINIANNIFGLMNFSQVNGEEDDKPHFIANPPNENNVQINNKSNVLFYDESEHADFELIEKNVSGAFIWAMETKSLDYVLDLLKNKNSIKQFILLIPGKYCEKILKFLNDKNYLNEFGSCIIFTKNTKFNDLKNQYNIIKGILKSKKEVIKYINEYNNPYGIYSTIKLINIKKYNDSYKSFHATLSSFYGESFNQTPDLYTSKIKLFQEFLEKTHNGTNILSNLSAFENNNMEGIIQLYTGNSIFASFNRWMYELDKLAYEKVGYFFASLMYNLNLYNETKNAGVKGEVTLYRGMSINYINLLPYKNYKEKVITFPSFTSTSTNVDSFTHTGNKETFGLKYIIKYNCKDNWIPTTIYIEDITECPGEEERLFLPFSFYKIINVDIDYDHYKAVVELETIGRKSILENDIKNNKKIIYNPKEKIMEAI